MDGIQPPAPRLNARPARGLNAARLEQRLALKQRARQDAAPSCRALTPPICPKPSAQWSKQWRRNAPNRTPPPANPPVLHTGAHDAFAPPDLSDVHLRIAPLDRPEFAAQQVNARTAFWRAYFDAAKIDGL